MTRYKEFSESKEEEKKQYQESPWRVETSAARNIIPSG